MLSYQSTHKSRLLSVTGTLVGILMCTFLTGCSLIFPGPPDRADLVGTWTYDPDASEWGDNTTGGTIEFFEDGSVTATDLPLIPFYGLQEEESLTFIGEWRIVSRTAGVNQPQIEMWDPESTANFPIFSRPPGGPSLVYEGQGDNITLFTWVGDPDSDIRYVLTREE